MPDAEERAPYGVVLTDEAFSAYAGLPTERLFKRVDHDLGLLEKTPYLGREYDPAYEAARPPFPCRVLYCGHYGIYYRVVEDARTVVVFAIEDQRRNPVERFSSIAYEAVSLPQEES